MTDTSLKAELPRFAKLEAFDPHRETFECKREVDVIPPISSEAEQLFQQALAMDSHEIWFDQRDYKKIASLYREAMQLGHWKAQFNLAGLYLKGLGVAQDVERAIQLTEDLMTKGVPAAWDNMGTYYMAGVGPLKQSATVAYAFWQRAADMGSMASQTFLGKKLAAVHDDPPSRWANRPLSRKMLECAFQQGYGEAAYQLGLDLNGDHSELLQDRPRALKVLHEGVKFGSSDCSNYLFSSFSLGNELAGDIKDSARADRYSALGDALERNPDLRFPNLDKVLPLPPARLPKWDGNKQTLIDAAKAVVPPPPGPPRPAASAASQRTGRAHVPDGFTLSEGVDGSVPAQYETTSAPIEGYWLAQLMAPRTDAHRRWNAAQLPMHYAKGELFDRSRPGLVEGDGRILFHYVGVPMLLPATVQPVDPYVARGIARQVPKPTTNVRCPGHRRCLETGIWSASVPDDHPVAAVYNQWHRQAYVIKSDSFPDPRDLHLEISPSQVTWHWWGQANEVRGGLTYLRLETPAGA